jgi:hypothetical protein
MSDAAVRRKADAVGLPEVVNDQCDIAGLRIDPIDVVGLDALDQTSQSTRKWPSRGRSGESVSRLVLTIHASAAVCVSKLRVA